MGMDIWLNLVKNGKYVKQNIFDGRDSDWFANLRKEGDDEEYEYLNTGYGYSDQAPAEYKEKYNKENDYFDFYYVSVKDFKEWFEKYRPDKKAGWATTYEKWRIENKGLIPEVLPIYIPEDANMADMHFIEYENKYDCSKWLYNYLVDNDIEDDVDIAYCFDW
jgi:hypothetical protein